jgi:5-formyltetrahydrofolate cyclo-ligase
MKKQKARTTNKLRRQNLSVETREELSMRIANKALQLPIWEHSIYHIFLAIETQAEINTDYLLHILNGKDKQIVIPKTDFKTRAMKSILLLDNTRLKLNAYNIPEPLDGIEITSEQIDVVFIPLLAFDKTGQRAGYGKGFYDAFLALCKPKTIKIGLSFFEVEEEPFEDVLNTDIPLDYCVTPEKVYSF